MKYKSIIVWTLFFLTSCSPKFYLKENTKIENLSLSLGFHKRISNLDKEKIQMELYQTIDEWNNEKHTFLLSIADTSSADLTILVDSISLPSKFLQFDAIFVNTALWVIAGYGVVKYSNPAFMLLGLIHFDPINRTFINYRLNQFSKKQLQFATEFKSKTILFKNKEKERNRHIRNFDTQLYNFIEKLEKEYKKKNDL